MLHPNLMLEGSMTLKNNTKNLILCSLFTALLVIGAFIRLPIGTVPITLQTLFVMMSAQVLGRKSVISVLIYIALGLLGLPVFSGGGGIGYILHPTFGYILGFLTGAYALGFFCEKNKKNSFPSYFFSSLFALFIIYLAGISYFCMLLKFYIKEQIDFLNILIYGALIFLPKDIFFCIISSFISKRINKVLKA